MSWVVAGMAAAGALKGGIDSKKNKKRQKQNDAFRKQAIAMSPWTGMGDPGAMDAGPTGMSAVLGGGLQGASIGAMGKGMFSGGGASTASAAPAASTGSYSSWDAMNDQGNSIVGGSAGNMGGGQNSMLSTGTIEEQQDLMRGYGNSMNPAMSRGYRTTYNS